MMKKLINWIDERYPLTSTWEMHLSKYYAPKNFNFWYYFGSLALLVLVIQIVTGIFLAMHFKPDASDAFASVEYIMRDVPWGWLIRYMHSTGASMFFIAVYLHMFRGLMYGSYKKPRELLWVIGMLIYVALMAEAFMGYLLPWGQMSYWGGQVIVSLFNTIPIVGDSLATWIKGDFIISDATLNRFFAFHIIAIPLILVILVFVHIVALHKVGSNNPDGINIKEHKNKDGVPLDGIPFHPFYTLKDIVGIGVFMMLFFAIVFYAPEMKGYFIEHANFIPANPMATPEHIAPLWYFTPFYAILRAFPGDTFVGPLLGVMAMGAAIMILFVLPWIDRGKVLSIRYRSTAYKILIVIFILSFFVLGYLGMKPATPIMTLIAQIASACYFGFFILLFFVSKNEKTKEVPKRVTK
jgi:ubiquinol-cytochrome c reductase cytochrome b subunit